MNLPAAHRNGRLRQLGRLPRWSVRPLAGAAVLLALGALAACGSDDPTATPVTSGPGATADAPTGFAAEWEALIKAAQDEGRLVMAGGGSSVNVRQYYEAFSEKFGIKTVVSGGSGTSQANRILAEQAAGRYEVDIVHAGNTTIKSRLGPRALQLIEPFLFHPEVLDQSLWYLGEHKYGDTERLSFVYAAEVSSPENANANMTLWYNTDLVSQAEIEALETPWDLLQEKWIGKFISHDPTGGGGGTGQLLNAWRDPNMGEEWLTAYWIGMQPFISNDTRVIESRLVTGASYWGYSTSVDAFDQLMAQGAPISDQFPRALSFISELTGGGTARSFSVAKNLPHPNATKLYINWFLSREGQTLMQASLPNPFDDCAYVSLREDDIPPGLTCPRELRQPGATYTWEPDLDPELEDLRFELLDWITELLGRTR